MKRQKKDSVSKNVSLFMVGWDFVDAYRCVSFIGVAPCFIICKVSEKSLDALSSLVFFVKKEKES